MRSYLFVGGVAHEAVEEVPDGLRTWKFPVTPDISFRIVEQFNARDVRQDRPDFSTSINSYRHVVYSLERPCRPPVKIQVFQWDQLSDRHTMEYLNTRYGTKGVINCKRG
jgi:hypothetical protein